MSSPKEHEMMQGEIRRAILTNPNQDPLVTIEGAVIQTGETHLKYALELIGMVSGKEIWRGGDGWEIKPDPLLEVLKDILASQTTSSVT